MTNNILLDSSILVEYIKGTKTSLLRALLTEEETILYINETIVSEFLFYFLAINGNASPQSLHSSSKIKAIFQTSNDFELLNRFNLLVNNEQLLFLTPHLMAKYNLLPNDAIILATCKIHNITKLASHDADFIIPCSEEEIELLTE